MAATIVSGILGFVAGIVFWHFVGFWSFVSAVVFKTEHGPMLASGAARAPDDGSKLPTTVFGGIPAADQGSAAGCTTLRLDRKTGRTSLTTCESIHRVPHVAGWAASLREAAGRGDGGAGAPSPPATGHD